MTVAAEDTGLGHAIRTGLLRNVLTFLTFFIAWKVSALFEVRPNVSAMYFACGVTFSVAVLFGWRYLLTAYASLVLVQVIDSPDAARLAVDWLGPLRQTLIYGIAGLSMRQVWLDDLFRLSMAVALRFLLTASAAALLSAMLTLQLAPFNALEPEQVADVFFSFWGGDFAGLMVAVPIVLMLHHAFTLASEGAGHELKGLLVERLGLRDAVWLSVLAVLVTLFAILTPHVLNSQVRIDEIVLLPVLLAGLWRGAFAGFAVAMQVCLMEIFGRQLMGIPIDLAIDLQLLIVMNAAVALLTGAAHDDKQFEWRRANFDALTGLANRSCFEDRLKLEFRRSFRTNQRFALLYLDLDGFKLVNDTFGHRTGDDMLRQTAKRLTAIVRDMDTVARLGGDEFAIILSETGDPAVAERVARKAVEAIARPYYLGGHTASVSISIGIAYSQIHGSSPTSLMHSADQAMYAAKAQGKNQFASSTADPPSQSSIF